ncbi:SMI1/KNR4 family protein [Chryseobacterium gallinarum]|uniref:SMI1/KNR4 family protein n=1 Tax=Chryseobacterium gallinarum TaxID=1324352 RepID=UPI002024D763|nr:SMI1/KNR4 family protein [Chryseobacterium gallinarum]MCL8537696.1 SMI1/KNR4 family protein [Chryseobacterium gallinarum]
MNPFKIMSIEAIETEILKEKRILQNFPKTVDFPFPDRYKSLVTSIKTSEIASEAILYSSVEAVNENKSLQMPDYWCFAGNGQGDRWFFDPDGNVLFYDHDDEKLQPMNINFGQWLQMAFIIQQLDEYSDEYDDIPETVKQHFYETLHILDPALSENYPFTV